MNKVSARSKRGNQAARIKAAAPVTDKPKSPASALHSAKARIEEASKVPPPPRIDGPEHPASTAARAAGQARRELGAMVVPVTLYDVSCMIGVDCKPEQFAATALMEISQQIDSIADIAEGNVDGSYEQWKLVRNLSHRAALAGRVTAWLELPTHATELPKVEP